MALNGKYRQSYKLTKKFGTSYFFATLLLDKTNRKHIYALYSLCRYADDLVDVCDGTPGMSATAEKDLDKFYGEVQSAIESGYDGNNLLGAISSTWNELELDMQYLHRFFKSMKMDLEITSYDTFDDLLVYMDGSAAVIGEMVLPVIEPDVTLHDDIRENARALGNAFQLTNFLRDIGEDLQRGRIYVPLKDLANFGIDKDRLEFGENYKDLMRFEIKRNRELYDQAHPGVISLKGRRGACVRTAYRLYGGILDEIERNSFDTLNVRARLSSQKKMATVCKELVRRNPKTFSSNTFC